MVLKKFFVDFLTFSIGIYIKGTSTDTYKAVLWELLFIW